MDRVTLVVADDHRIVRGGLRLLLNAEPDFEVVAEAGDVEAARRALLAHRPRVLVLDLNMPGPPTLPAIPALREEFPETEIVVLTMQDDPGYAREALRAGAAGFVLKRSAEEELVAAVRAAAAGDAYLNPQLGARLAVAPPDGPPAGLTEEDAELLRLVALGHTNADIGERLHLSPRTVEARRSRVQRSLGLESRAAVVRYALDQGLIG